MNPWNADVRITISWRSLGAMAVNTPGGSSQSVSGRMRSGGSVFRKRSGL
jgi:hypothetical protein